MFVYLIHTAMTGSFSSLVFSSQELAEQSLIEYKDLFSDVVRVTVDSGENEWLPESPALFAIRSEWRRQALSDAIN